MPQRRSAFLALPVLALFCIGLLVLWDASSANARDVVVTLKDGTQIRGEMVGDNPEGVTLLISGIRRQFDRVDIEEISVVKTPAVIFRERRAALEADNYRGRLELATWAYDQGLYEIALQELRDLQSAMPEDNPDYRRVGLLARVIDQRIQAQEMAQRQAQQQRATQQQDAAPPAEQGPGENGASEDPQAGTGSTGSRGRRGAEAEMLTDEQINVIKVYEISLAERPAVIVPPDTVEKLFDQYKAESALAPFMNRRGQGTFRALRGWQQLDVMFQVGARNLYDEVIVREHPPAMLTWVRNLHRTYVLNYCGTANCHGGEDTNGGYPLFLGRVADVRVAYTNFYILNETKTMRGSMIDRSRPADSLLIQYGLPREVATHPHPIVENGAWRPAFRGEPQADRNYQLLVDWMGRQLYRPAPTYGINYDVPDPGPAVPDVPAEDEDEDREIGVPRP